MDEILLWYKTFSLRVRVYILVSAGILLLPFSRENIYEYSYLTWIIYVLFLGLISVESFRYSSRQPEYTTSKNRYKLVKLIVSAPVVGALTTFGFSCYLGIAMDIFNDEPKNMDIILTNYDSKAGRLKTCAYVVRGLDLKGEKVFFCVSHIENHFQLREHVNKVVVFTGRSSWAGDVVDGLKIPQRN